MASLLATPPLRLWAPFWALACCIPNGLAQNGYGPGYLGEYSLASALVFEVVMTFLFVTVIFGATGSGSAPGLAGLAIGLTLAAIHLVGINVTGVS